MTKKVSKKQLKANRENSKKGGVKTPEGKEISRMNSLKYGIYSPILFDEKEKNRYMLIRFDLMDEYMPKGISEESLINQIALYEIKIQRVSYMEEYFNSIASFEGTFMIIENMSPNEESSDLLYSLYDYMMKSTDILKYRNLEPIEKMQKYREMLENRKSKCLNELMKVKFFKKNIVI